MLAGQSGRRVNDWVESRLFDAFGFERVRPSSAWATVWPAGSALGTLRLPGARLSAEDSAERSPAAPALDEAVWAVASTPPLGALACADAPMAFEPAGFDAAAADWVEAELAEDVLGLGRSVVSVWLMLINCSRLFTLTN